MKSNLDAKHVLGIVGGIILVLNGVVGSIGFIGIILDILHPYLGPVVDLVAIVLNSIAMLGGISVLIGTILLAANIEYAGKPLVYIGVGISLISMTWQLILFQLGLGETKGAAIIYGLASGSITAMAIILALMSTVENLREVVEQFILGFALTASGYTLTSLISALDQGLKLYPMHPAVDIMARAMLWVIILFGSNTGITYIIGALLLALNRKYLSMIFTMGALVFQILGLSLQIVYLLRLPSIASIYSFIVSVIVAGFVIYRKMKYRKHVLVSIIGGAIAVVDFTLFLSDFEEISIALIGLGFSGYDSVGVTYGLVVAGGFFLMLSGIMLGSKRTRMARFLDMAGAATFLFGIVVASLASTKTLLLSILAVIGLVISLGIALLYYSLIPEITKEKYVKKEYDSDVIEFDLRE